MTKPTRRKHPAFARDVIARRQAGERIGLLVVSVHSWRAGKWFEARPEVARVVVPPDQPASLLRFDCALHLDVVLCGDCSDDVLYAAADSLLLYRPGSIWAEFDDGFYLLERTGSRWLIDSSNPVPLSGLAAAVRAYRMYALAQQIGPYSATAFDPARQAFIAGILGDAA